MDVDEDLVTRFIRHDYMGFIVRILEPERRKLQRIFCYESDGGQVLDKILLRLG